jgi:hypothetical protein
LDLWSYNGYNKCHNGLRKLCRAPYTTRLLFAANSRGLGKKLKFIGFFIPEILSGITTNLIFAANSRGLGKELKFIGFFIPEILSGITTYAGIDDPTKGPGTKINAFKLRLKKKNEER